jgi:glycosyltransferase involved in cell wall biosynthesis
MVLDISVVVPVRNAEHLIAGCLMSIAANGPREIIVVDGRSTDRTVELAERWADTILSDEGGGLPVARAVGATAASSPLVALIDVDVELPEGALGALIDEFKAGTYAGLQAGLYSVAPPGYWGQALAEHHRTGRSRYWFGLVATIFYREVLLEHGFDRRFMSGEDIELRWRLQRQGLRVGVSRTTIVRHRFAEDTFDFARGQWLADGVGLGRMIRKHGWRGARLIALPITAGLRGVLLTLARGRPKWIPYYVLFTLYNYVGMIGAAFEGRR